MAYILNGDRPLIFCANPRTGSSAIASAMRFLGGRQDGGHHDQPFYIPPRSIVFQVVRNHLEVINSFWWKSKPTGNFENFLDLVLSGRYPYIRTPRMYWRKTTHKILYDNIEEGFKWVCGMAGLESPGLHRTPSRTQGWAFQPHLEEQVREVYREEMIEYEWLPNQIY